MQETLSERSAQPRADVDRSLAAGDAAGRNNPPGTSSVDADGIDHDPIRPNKARPNKAEPNAIEKSIAETLMELDADDQGPFEVGAVPLDDLDAPPQPLSAGRSAQHKSTSCSQGASRRDPTCRLILMAMLITALTALGMVSFAATEGFIP